MEKEERNIPSKVKKLRGVSKAELLHLDKDELVERILQLEAHNLQLKNIIAKKLSVASESKQGNKKKTFDFAKCHFRRIFLRILYFGWDYQGLAMQEDSVQTIEHHLFQALVKSCLVASREMSQYHRCGRTDKGVSAFGQVISIKVRSRFPVEQQSVSDELPYCKMLNRILPKEIRAVAWMPIPEGYSARFDCKKRQYKYYFPRSSLNIAAMNSACAHLVGSHDFRHLCKMDVGNGVTEFVRNILAADVAPVDDKDTDNVTSMYCFTIEGNAFLWHQIRCIMGVLLLIGQGMETSDVVKELLDVHTNERKPQYNMALHVPLNLFKCTYDIEDEERWVYDVAELKTVIAQLQGYWTLHSVKATMIQDSLKHLEREYTMLTRESGTEDKDKEDSIMCHTECLLQGVKPKVYIPLLKRDTCSSLEEKIEYYRKKRKVTIIEETSCKP